MMQSKVFSQRLKALIGAFVVVLVAGVSLVAAPRQALALPAGTPPELDRYLTTNGFFWSDVDNAFHVKATVDDAAPIATQGWYNFAQASRYYDFAGQTVKLDSDIDFSGIQDQNGWNQVTGSGDNDAFTVGNDDRPFQGTFDGGDHTLSGFRNERDGLLLQLDCGFFGWTNNAAIKNVKFKECYVGATFRGGLVAGYAQDTFFLNITCEDCTTSVIPGNNVVNLITNAGLAGGMIAGETNGSTLYNCEVVAGGVVTNATSGVGALGGQPLYLGGLVGAANDTVIEYCRVTDKWVDDGDDGKVRDYCGIQNKYGTAVSVANYSEVFTGGIVGMMQGEDTGSKIVDCYSTADVYSEASIYFAVGLGLGVTRGYTGGIAGIVRGAGDGTNLIERVSYAGNLHSRTWNVLLLGIPIIEYDNYMGGITGRGGDNCTINQAYYLRSASSTKKDFYAVKTTYDGGYSNGAAYGPRDENYTDRKYWEGCGFDFAKGTIRNLGEAYQFTAHVDESEWSKDHYNKWVMDYNRGIPVHGGSIKATFDFPNSGEVTIGYTDLAWDAKGSNDGIGNDPNAQTTTNSFDFAVQGFEQNDSEITLRYKLYENDDQKNDSWKADSNNDGYRIRGWYGARNVKVNAMPSSHNYFTSSNTMLDTDSCGQGLLSEKHLIDSNDNQDAAQFDLTVKEPDGDEASENWTDAQYEDNDLYVARAEAQVLLHDVNGNIINKETTERDNTKDDDWYGYEDTLELPESVVADAESVQDTATLIGWTTMPREGKGYVAATSTEINNLKGQNAFFEPGSLYSVTQPVNLYPVYADLISNVTVVFEGNDQDAADDNGFEGGNDISKRDGYGQAFVRTDDGGNYISIDDIEGTAGDTNMDAIDLTTSPLHESYDAADTATNPDGPQMRFLGWYEEVTEDGETFEVRVSDQPKFYLTDVDLTQEHTYTARFEYCVRYWWSADDANVENYKPYSLDWVKFGTDRYDPSLDGYDQDFKGWLTGGKANNDFVLNKEDAASIFANQSVDEVSRITFPISFHGVWDGDSGVDVEVHTDFPTGPQFDLDFDGSYGDNLVVDMSMEGHDDFTFHLWTGECGNWSDWKNLSTNSYWDAGNHFNSATYEYWFNAHVTADVNFHGVGEDTVTVQRRYMDEVFIGQPIKGFEYSYHYDKNQNDHTNVTVDIDSAPSDDKLERSGYIFLGWIDKNTLGTTDAERENVYNYIFNGNQIDGTDVKVVKDVHRALPYLVTSEDEIEVRHPMDFYPVYVGFDIETTTNIFQAGVDADIYNIPGDPGISDSDPKIEPVAGTVQVAYNDDNNDGAHCGVGDGSLISGFSSPATISYDSNNTAKLDITTAANVSVWNLSVGELTDDQKAEKYTLLSLSVTKNGEVVDTLYPDEALTDENETYVFEDYIIDSGNEYVFTANYSPVPVMVIYHLGGEDGKETDSYSTEVGSLLPSTTKTPWFYGYDDDDSLNNNMFFVGWAVGSATGDVDTWDPENEPVLAKPGVDTVTGITHLWPVYRQSNVTPVSNIDNNGTVTTSHRRATKHANDTSTLWLEADEVPGYEFEGWTTGYDSVTGKYDELFTTSAQTALTGDARFDTSVTYTAIYEEVAAQVRYHGIDGNVIYTASVSSGSSGDSSDPAADPNRSFVYQTDLGSGEQTWVPIDTEAFTAIAADVAQENEDASDGTYMEFVTWQLVENSKAERWGSAEDEESFVRTSIATLVEGKTDRVLDLYPVVATINATDTKDAPYSALTPQFVLETNENKIAAANITLKESYDQEYLKVHIDEVAYAPTDDDNPNVVLGADTPLMGIPVKLFGLGSSMDEPMASDTTRAEDGILVTLPNGDVTLNRGDAIFTFTGFINIQKRTTDANAAGKTFTFTVKSGEDERKVTVKVGDEAEGGYYTGSVRVAVPFGDYVISEDTNWSWRYTVQLDKWGKDDEGNYSWSDTNNSAEVKLTYTSEVTSGNPDGATSAVRATNKRTNNKWSDGSDYKHNVFNEGGN